MSSPKNSALNPRLDSWKEIAAYLGRDVRTVMRWEKERALPVYRIPGGRRNAVFALTAELDAWNEPLACNPVAAGPPVPSPRKFRAFHGWASGAAALLLIAVSAVVLIRHTLPRAEQISIKTPNGAVLHYSVHRTLLASLYGVTAADINNDGILDLVASGGIATSTVSVMAGAGAGHFTHPTLHNACRGTIIPIVADMDNDGIPDIVVSCQASGNAAVLRGDGKGNFQQSQVLSVPCSAFGVHAADFDHDGWLDLAVVCTQGNVFVFHNQHPSFQRVFTFVADHDLRQAAVADFDGDGFTDIAIPTGRQVDKRIITILFGSADLTFNDYIRIEAPLANSGLGGAGPVAADFNLDGKPDLAVPNADKTVYAWLNTGNRSFSPPHISNTGSTYANVIAVDLDGDGWPDLVATNAFENSCSVLFGRGDGTFSTPHLLTHAEYALLPLAADFNHDGRPDVVFSSPPSDTVVLVLSSSR